MPKQKNGAGGSESGAPTPRITRKFNRGVTTKKSARPAIFCTKESILDQLERAKDSLSGFHESCEDINKVRITLRNAIKFISYSSPISDRAKPTNLAVSKKKRGNK